MQSFLYLYLMRLYRIKRNQRKIERKKKTTNLESIRFRDKLNQKVCPYHRMVNGNLIRNKRRKKNWISSQWNEVISFIFFTFTCAQCKHNLLDFISFIFFHQFFHWFQIMKIFVGRTLHPFVANLWCELTILSVFFVCALNKLYSVKRIWIIQWN